MRKRYNVADASLDGITNNTLYERLYTNPSTFGTPYAVGESWTFFAQTDSNQPAGCSNISDIQVTVDAMASVTVPAGTFTCYKITLTLSGKTIIEYWYAEGRFPYGPIKIVDGINFVGEDIKELQSVPRLP